MKVKKYIQFVKESTGYKLGCVMVEVPVKNWNEITSIINKDDLYEVEGEKYGIQENPHLTLLYGLKPNITKEQVEQVLEKSVDGEKIEIEIENI
jgi:hypothetical protein